MLGSFRIPTLILTDIDSRGGGGGGGATRVCHHRGMDNCAEEQLV